VSDNGVAQTETLALFVQANIVTDTALVLGGAGLHDDQFRGICKWLGAVRNWSAWAMGDAILYAESISDDLAAEIVEYLGRAKSTCGKYAWLANQYKPDQRVTDVSPTHHEYVATWPDAKRQAVLLKAQRENLSVEEFRGLVREDSAQKECTCIKDGCPKHGTVQG